MAFISLPIVNKPRKLSRKQKEKLKQQKAIVKKNKEERGTRWKTVPVHVSSEVYVPNRNAHLSINSNPLPLPNIHIEYIREESEEMIEREKAALLIKEELKKQTAPLYNKGPYQFIGTDDPEIIKNLGKKV